MKDFDDVCFARNCPFARGEAFQTDAEGFKAFKNWMETCKDSRNCCFCDNLSEYFTTKTFYMNVLTGSVDTIDGWDYTDIDGKTVNAVDLGEVVKVEITRDSNGVWNWTEV